MKWFTCYFLTVFALFFGMLIFVVATAYLKGFTGVTSLDMASVQQLRYQSSMQPNP